MIGTISRLGRTKREFNLSQVFAGQTVGIKQTDERIWLVSFIVYDLGYFDDEPCRLEPLANPFGPKVLPMSSVSNVTHVSGTDPGFIGAPVRTKLRTRISLKSHYKL
jgi:hypothetical protein